ncbi:MAG: hypothetical protein ACR2Q3_19735 [Woeseiaceae bacterium]
MPTELASFAFIITLAAVVNGLGIVRWLTGFSEYLRRRKRLSIKPYWVFVLIAGFQFLLHVLMWWSLWSVRGTGEINFLIYVYLLAGPILLYLGTSVLAPDIVDGSVDMKAHYFGARTTYSSILALLWFWAIFMSPVLRGEFAPTLPVFAMFFAAAVVQRLSGSPGVQVAVAVANWILFVCFIGLYAMRLDGASA